MAEPDAWWSLVGDVEVLGDPVAFGPAGDQIPERFRATLNYGDRRVTVVLTARFGGERVAVDEVAVQAGDKESGVTPRDLTALELGAVVRHASEMAVHPGHGAHVGRRPGRKPTPEELRLLAAVYWFHFVTWGNPRQAVMTLWNLPRSTANGWIRRARELYPMPGDGGGGERGEHPEAR